MPGCPCGSIVPYEKCCGPLLAGEKDAATAEALMRSRYTAYTRAEIPYLLETTHPAKKDTYDPESMRRWAEESRWQGLEIIAVEKGGPDDENGQVEFIARYAENGNAQDHDQEGVEKDSKPFGEKKEQQSHSYDAGENIWEQYAYAWARRDIVVRTDIKTCQGAQYGDDYQGDLAPSLFRRVRFQNCNSLQAGPKAVE